MKPITFKYRIRKISRVGEGVEMTLSETSEIQIPSPPRAEEAPIDPKWVIEPMPATDDERTVDNYMKTLKEKAPSLYEAVQRMINPESLSPQMLMSAVISPPERPSSLEVSLPLSGYRKLGSPSLDDVIEVTLKVSGDKQ